MPTSPTHLASELLERRSDPKSRAMCSECRACIQNIFSGEIQRADGAGQGTPTHAALPLEPPVGVLVRLALCLDPGFARLQKNAKEARLQEMRKLYDEVVGQGYYQQDRNSFYQGAVSMNEGIAAILREAGVVVPTKPRVAPNK